ncbi:MAG: hypothetical protein WC196_02795 [Bacilli bacterium]
MLGILNIIWMWLKQLIMLPVNLAKVASIDKHLELQKELSETQQRLENTEKQLAKDAAIKSGRMFFCNNVMWAKDENDKIETSPYCPRCFELDGETVHLIVRCEGIYFYADCPECKVKEIPFQRP